MSRHEAFESINKEYRINTISDSKQCENSMFSTQNIKIETLKHFNI